MQTQVSVPYTAIEYRYFQSGITLRYCAATGLFEEHANELCTIHSLGLRHSRETVPTVWIGSDSDWPNDDEF